MNTYLSTIQKRLLAALFVGLLFTLPFTVLAENNGGSGKSAFLANNDEEKFLSPDEAFKLSVNVLDSQTLQAAFKVAPGHYLYRARISFELKSPIGNSVKSIDLPKGEIKQDATFGQSEVYHHDIMAEIKLAQPVEGKVTLAATYQGCSEKGLCYAPIHKNYDLDLASTGGRTQNTNTLGFVSQNTGNDGEAANLLKSGKLWLIVIGFFGFGLLLSLTPCVLPMIPILSGIIVGSKQTANKAPSRLHSFNLSLAYTLGMALSYTLAGIAAGLSGQLLSNTLQNAWVLSATGLVFVLLALSMFGFYELKLPAAFESSMVNVSNRIKGGRFVGVFIMGALSALIVSPCVAAPLAGALIYISKTHDVLLGGIALFSLSIGMGVPLLLLGASAGSLLPKTGQWMNTVRNFFGVVMLGVAIWIITPLVPVSLQIAMWAALLIVPAIYMHALDGLPVHASPWMKFWKGMGVIALVLGVALLIGALSGAKSPLQPLSGLQANVSSTPKAKLSFQRINSLAELENYMQNSAGKTVMLDFYADWCVACKELEQFTFSDMGVQKSLENVVLLQADLTTPSNEGDALLKRFGLFGLPGIIFFDSNGQQIPSLKVVGYQDAEEFKQTLHQITSRN
ncbi:MAG TPA: protein-disulfide reductase DsbD [Methylophilaceae bacterium]